VSTIPPLPAIVGRCGQQIYTWCLDANGIHSPVTAVASNPTFSVNGTALASVVLRWLNGTNSSSALSFWLPAKLNLWDVVTMTAPAGWCTCAAGSAPAAANAPIGNYAGRDHPGIGAFLVDGRHMMVDGDFEAPRTMGLGYNTTWNGQSNQNATYSLWKNQLLRATPWSAVTAKDVHGSPTTLSGPSTATISAISQSNQVDGRGYPVLSGVWAIRGNESAPATPMTVSCAVSSPAAIVSSNGPVPGMLVNGVDTGRMWLFEVRYPANPSTFEVALTVTLTPAGGGAGPVTLSELELLAPGEDWESTDCVSQVVKDWLATEAGNCVDAIRCVDLFGNDGQSAIVDSIDLPDPASFTRNPYNRGILCASIRNYSPATSASVFFSQQWRGTSAASAVNPANVGYLNFSGPNTGWVVGEIVTPSPHYLRTGQWVAISQGFSAVTVTNGPSATLVSDMTSLNLQVFVTSPTSFAVSWYAGATNGNTMPGGINNVVGTQVQATDSAIVTVATPDIGAPAIEWLGALMSAFPKPPTLIVPINIGASDNAVYAIARKLLATTQPGGEFILELGNEVWSDDYATVVAAAYAMLGAGGPFTSAPVPWYAQFQVVRSGQLKRIFQRVFGSRASEIKLAINGQWGYAAGPLTWLMTTCNAWNAANPAQPVEWDYHMVAPYHDCPNDSTVVAGVTSIATGGWTRQGYLEACGIWLKYNTTYLAENPANNGTYFPTIRAVLNQYVAGGSQPAGYKPILGTYEGGIQLLGFGTPAQMVDLHDDPESYRLHTAWCELMQFAGVKLAIKYGLCMPPQLSTYLYMWGDLWGAGQGPSRGDGSDGKPVNVFAAQTGAFNAGNGSVQLQASRDWWDRIARDKHDYTRRDH
jgi:hypothetical protein